MAALPDPTATLTGEGRRIYEHIKARLAARGVDHLGPYLPLLHHPELARDIEELGYYYKFEAELPRDVYQFIVLTFARRSGVTFIWEDHVAAARKAGLPEAVIDAIRLGAATFAAPYDLVAETTGYAFACRSIPEALQNEVIAKFGVKGLIEIVTLCGFYTMIGMVNGCFDVPLPTSGGH